MFALYLAAGRLSSKIDRGRELNKLAFGDEGLVVRGQVPLLHPTVAQEPGTMALRGRRFTGDCDIPTRRRDFTKSELCDHAVHFVVA